MALTKKEQRELNVLRDKKASYVPIFQHEQDRYMELVFKKRHNHCMNATCIGGVFKESESNCKLCGKPLFKYNKK